MDTNILSILKIRKNPFSISSGWSQFKIPAALKFAKNQRKRSLKATHLHGQKLAINIFEQFKSLSFNKNFQTKY